MTISGESRLSQFFIFHVVPSGPSRSFPQITGSIVSSTGAHGEEISVIQPRASLTRCLGHLHFWTTTTTTNSLLHSSEIKLITMPKLVLTGVGGGIGGIAADYALEIARPDQKFLFTSTDLSKLPASKVDGWKAKGAEVAEANYDDPESLSKVFKGAEAVAFISTWALGHRPRQAANVIEAAKAAGVNRICYTSFIAPGWATTQRKPGSGTSRPSPSSLGTMCRRSG